MSTKAERRQRAKRRIMPIKLKVRQKDGSIVKQTVDADMRVFKPKRKE